MKLKENFQAIDFETKDIYGTKIKLSDYKGKKIHLGFFRNVACPFCNLRVHQLTKLREEFERKGLHSIFFFESSPQVLLRSSFHQCISPVPLVGDPERTVYTQYGVESSVFKMLTTLLAKGTVSDMKAGKALNLPEDKHATQSLIPADFLIDQNFVIARAHYGSNINDHISIEELRAFAG
ncbi:MAG: redoxin domain-containing protein [Flammeovirgaceae bacterium]